MNNTKIINEIMDSDNQHILIKHSLDVSLNWDIRTLAISKLNDTKILEEITDNDEMLPIRNAALERLLLISDDENFKGSFALNDNDWEIRIIACNCINNPEILYAVLEVEEDKYVRGAARERLKELGFDPDFLNDDE